MNETSGYDPGVPEQSVVRIQPKATWRQKLAKFVLGKPKLVRVDVGKHDDILDSMTWAHRDIVEKEITARSFDSPSIRFEIIHAENGKIIRYSPMGAGKGRDGLYLVPEGEDLMGAIARVIVKERLQP